MKFSKIIMFLLVVFMLFSVAGCGSKETTTDNKDGDQATATEKEDTKSQKTKFIVKNNPIYAKYNEDFFD